MAHFTVYIGKLIFVLYGILLDKHSEVKIVIEMKMSRLHDEEIQLQLLNCTVIQFDIFLVIVHV